MRVFWRVLPILAAMACSSDPDDRPGDGGEPTPSVTDTSDPDVPTTTDDLVHDVVEMPSWGVLDILLVVDDSCSMQPHLPGLDEFAEGLWAQRDSWRADAHLGVIAATAPSDGGLRMVDGHRWVELDTPNGEAVFREMVTQGLNNGPPGSMGFDAVTRALAAADGGVNDGFAREDAGLAVIVITDDNETSQISPAEFASALTALARPGLSYLAYVDAALATRYSAVVDELGTGAIGDVYAVSDDGWEDGANASNHFDDLWGDRLPAGVCTSQVADVATLIVELQTDTGMIPVASDDITVVDDPAFYGLEAGGTCVLLPLELLEYDMEVHLTYEPA